MMMMNCAIDALIFLFTFKFKSIHLPSLCWFLLIIILNWILAQNLKNQKLSFHFAVCPFFSAFFGMAICLFYFTVFPVIINNLIPLFPVWTAEWVVAALIFLSFSVVLSCNVKKKIAKIFLLFFITRLFF